MSNTTKQPEQPCDVEDASGAIRAIIHPKEKDLGNFNVRRVLPNARQRAVGPWVFFDHMGPADFPPGKGIDVRPHPHINLATVTYLFEGEILHRDSLGSHETITPGDINLMVAGKGIVHSERERDEVRNSQHRLHGLQLWLALPRDQEEIDPGFYHYPSSDIPALNVEGVPLRVMMGSAWGVTSPVKTFADTLYIEAHLQAGQTLTLPEAEERALYIADGQVTANGRDITQYAMAVMETGEVTVTATEDTRLAMVGGEQIGKRYIEWNFVSSRPDRIAEAKEAWKGGQFPKVPGDEKEFIPLPE